jgi:hypothetical protein
MSKRTLSIWIATAVLGAAGCGGGSAGSSAAAEPSPSTGGTAGEPAATTPGTGAEESGATASTGSDATAEEGLPSIPPREDDADRKSKNGRTEGTIDGVRVVIQYGRPKARGRDLWGGLVPYGTIWRTGANEATTITFDAPVQIEGQRLDRGTYSLFTIPGKEEWTVIFNRKAKQWGAKNYDESKDALRVKVEPAKAEEQTEEMTFSIEGSSVVLRWGKREVSFGVTPA